MRTMSLYLVFVLCIINLSCSRPQIPPSGLPSSTSNNYIVSLRKDVNEFHADCAVNTSALGILAPCNRHIPSVATFSVYDAELVLCMGVYDSILRLCDLGSKLNGSVIDRILASRGNLISSDFCVNLHDILESVNTSYTQTVNWVILLKQNLRNASVCDRACNDLNGGVNPLCSFIYEANVVISNIEGTSSGTVTKEGGVNSSKEASQTAANVSVVTTKNDTASKSSKVSDIGLPDAKDNSTINSVTLATKEENSGQGLEEGKNTVAAAGSPSVSDPEPVKPVEGGAGTTTVDAVNSSPGSTQTVETKGTANVQPALGDAAKQPSEANTGDGTTQIEPDVQFSPEATGKQTNEHNTAPIYSDGDGLLPVNDSFASQSYGEPDAFPIVPPTGKDHTVAKVTNGAVLPISEGTDFVDAEDSHFFVYFVTMVVLCVIGYLVFHNKQKILALTLEGRSRKNLRRRQSATKYKKLDSNLEEAVTSACKQSTTSIIY